MKKLLITLICIISCITSFAQFPEFNLEATTLKKFGNIKSDQEIIIKRFICKPTLQITGLYAEEYFLETNCGEIEINNNLDKCIFVQTDDIQDLWDYKIITGVLPSLKKYGFQRDIREEARADALKFIQMLEDSNLILKDPILEDYLYQLVLKIAPRYYLDGRIENLNIIIHQSNIPNAYCYPNGTIVINTGLLSVIHTEDELVALLAHEIAHFVLDHSINNINIAITRLKRAEFWGTVATVATAASEIAIAVDNPYYTPGFATATVAATSAAIAESMVEHLGMEYTQQQEVVADDLAIKILELSGYDNNALSTVFHRIKEWEIINRDYKSYHASDTHNALYHRINNAGQPYNRINKSFEQMVSLAVTSTAIINYNMRLYAMANALVDQNIANNIASNEDYIIKVLCTLKMYNDAQHNAEALDTLNIVLENSMDLMALKYKVVILLRLGNITEAQSTLDTYYNLVSNMRDMSEEQDWVTETQHKLTRLYTTQ